MLSILLLAALACRTETTPPCEVVQGFLDQDGDGVGGSVFQDCAPPQSFVLGGGDCDDADATVYPGALELCDGQDLDCDGEAETLSWWIDQDQDGFGAGQSAFACAAPDGWVDRDGDCDDLDPQAWPGAEEIWYDDVDQDCAGGDDWDQDGDGSPAPLDCDDLDPAVSPLLFEVCGNGVDDDCSGEIDDCQFFGGVAPGGPELSIFGLKSSAYGEQQWTGSLVLPLGDLDGDGMEEIGLCSDTTYNGGFHVFYSGVESGTQQDLKDASVCQAPSSIVNR